MPKVRDTFKCPNPQPLGMERKGSAGVVTGGHLTDPGGQCSGQCSGHSLHPGGGGGWGR